MRADRLLAVGHQGADDGRRQAEMGDPVALDERPQPVRAREVRRALVEHEPRTEHQRPRDRPRTHHPAEVGEPEQRVAGAQVELVRQVLRGLDREAAVDMDGPLGPSGRARRVDEQVRRLRVDLATDDRFRLARHRGVPPGVAPVVPRRLDRRASASHDHDAADSRRVGDRGVRDRLEGHPRAASEEAVRGDQHGRLAIGEAGGDRGRAVAAEDRRVDGLQPPECEHRDDRLHEHREEDPDAIAGPDAECRQPSRGDVDGRRELRVRQAPHIAVLALPHDRLAVGVTSGARFGGRPRVVEFGAAPPARPRRPVGQVEHLPRGRPQAMPMSSAAAPQNQPGSATAWAWSASSVGSPVERRNRVSRAASTDSLVGRHATPSTSRPKIGQSSVIRQA